MNTFIMVTGVGPENGDLGIKYQPDQEPIDFGIRSQVATPRSSFNIRDFNTGRPSFRSRDKKPKSYQEIMWNKLNRTDRRILTTAALLVALMLYLLYDDSLLLPSDSSSDLNAIGHVVGANQDVRRKFAKEFIWKSVRKQDAVHIGDSIFTGQGSNVEIELSDGRKLKLQENSMVSFNMQGNQMNLDLRFGRLAGKLDGCVKMTIKGQEKEVCGSDSDVEIDSDGVVKIDSPLPAESISWITPPPQILYHYKYQDPLILSWKTQQEFSRYHLQLSRQKDFKTLVYDERTQRKEIATHGYPIRGEYFLRIRADDIKGFPIGFSKTEAIKIQEVDPPVITAPLAKTQFSVKTSVDGDLLENNQVQIQWTYPMGNVHYDLEVSRDKDFQDILAHIPNITTTEARTPKLDTGTYYVRVRDATLTGKTQRPWSQITSFRVDILPAPKVTAPKLLTENVKYVAPSTEDLTLKWEPIPQARQYALEVSTTSDFSESKEFKTNQTEFTWKNLKAGNFYFRVVAETAKGTASEPSAIGQIEVRLKQPVLNPAEPRVVLGKTPEDPGDPQTFSVSWSDLKIAENYTVEVADNPSFTQKKVYETNKPSADIVLATPGEYFWRVKAKSKEGRSLTPYSDQGQLKYILKVPLSTPELMEPFDQATLFFQKSDSPFLWFEWKNVRQSSMYLLEVATDPQFTQKVLSVKTASRRYLVKEKLPTSTLYWRVQAFNDERESYWSPPRQMNLFSGRAPAGRKPSGKRR